MTVALSSSAVTQDDGNDPDFAVSIVAGLREPQKRIESKWLYDKRGSRLFDRITELDEYYPTRTENAILRQRAAALRRFVGEGTALVELGSGSSTKTRLLLDALPGLESYAPVDISVSHLRSAANRLSRDYQKLHVHPLLGDFTEEIQLPPQLMDAPKVLFFPGSTIGNFSVDGATDLLASLRKMKNVTALVVGVDLVKSRKILIPAYDDALGVTAEFNLNLLNRMNRELGADFELEAFHHEARWNAAGSRIEMHLVSRRAQRVHILGEQFVFSEAETIHTENSHKFTRERFAGLAADANWKLETMWTDPAGYFGVAVLTTAASRETAH